MKDNIDEFLNGYIDGELTQRQQIELQRLIKHDEQVAKRLDQLQKAKMLVASLPQVDAPAGMVDRIMTTLETRAILEHEPIVTSPRAGAAYLFGRKLVAAAAMITLMAVLAVVVYTILAPHSETPNLPYSPITVAAAPEDFHGRLELKTANFAAFNAVLARAIDSVGLEDSTQAITIDGGKAYNLTCSRDSAKALMAKLSDVWNKLDAAKIVVETDTFAKEVAVDNVTTQQIEQIVESNTLNERIDLAVELATANQLAKLVPNKDILHGVQNPTIMPTMVIPVFTSDNTDPHPKTATPAKHGERVNLTIILESQ
jgi:hypothetical protein